MTTPDSNAKPHSLVLAEVADQLFAPIRTLQQLGRRSPAGATRDVIDTAVLKLSDALSSLEYEARFLRKVGE